MLAGAERLVKCVIEDTKLPGLQPKRAIFRDLWRHFIHGTNY